MKDSVVAIEYQKEFTAVLVRCNNSDDAPGFGKMYAMYICDPCTMKPIVLAFNDRFLSDELAQDFLSRFVISEHDEIVGHLGLLR